MPLRYKIIEAKKLVYAEGTGSITFAELMEHIDALANDPAYHAPMKKLVDYTRLDLIRLTMTEEAEFTRRKAELDKIFAGERCAIVAPKDANYGMARAHTMFIDGADLDTTVFRDLDEALIWLDVTLDSEDLFHN